MVPINKNLLLLQLLPIANWAFVTPVILCLAYASHKNRNIICTNYSSLLFCPVATLIVPIIHLKYQKRCTSKITIITTCCTPDVFFYLLLLLLGSALIISCIIRTINSQINYAKLVSTYSLVAIDFLLEFISTICVR